MPGEKIEPGRSLLSQFLGHHHVADQQGQGPVLLASLGGEDSPHRVQVQGIAHQGVERVGGNGDHLSSTDGRGRALNGAFGGALRVNLYEVGGHV